MISLKANPAYETEDSLFSVPKENGNANSSIKTLQRLAAAMGKTLKIEFL